MLRITPTGFAPVVLVSTAKPPFAPYWWILGPRVNLHGIDAKLKDYFVLYTHISYYFHTYGAEGST